MISHSQLKASGEHRFCNLTFEYLANAQCVAMMISLAVTTANISVSDSLKTKFNLTKQYVVILNWANR